MQETVVGKKNNQKPTGPTHDVYLNNMKLIQKIETTHLTDNQKMQILGEISQTSRWFTNKRVTWVTTMLPNQGSGQN